MIRPTAYLFLDRHGFVVLRRDSEADDERAVWEARQLSAVVDLWACRQDMPHGVLPGCLRPRRPRLSGRQVRIDR
jgi:hypothetical protein